MVRKYLLAALALLGVSGQSFASTYVVQDPANYSNSVSIYSFGYSVPFGGVINDTYRFSLSNDSNLDIGLGYSPRYAQFPEYGYFELFGSDGTVSLSSGISSFSLTSQMAVGSFIGLAAGDYDLLVHVQQSPTIDSNFNYQLSIQSAPMPVPEPEIYSMFLAGLGLLGAVARRRKNRQAAGLCDSPDQLTVFH